MRTKHPALVYRCRFLLILGVSLISCLFFASRVPAQCQGCGRCLYCVEGNCIPNRTTFGYHQTHWRRSPCNPTFGDVSSSAQESSGLPDSEVPDRKEETSIRPDLPEQKTPDGEPSESTDDIRVNPFADEPISQVEPIEANFEVVRQTAETMDLATFEQTDQRVAELAYESVMKQADQPLIECSNIKLDEATASRPIRQVDRLEFMETPRQKVHDIPTYRDQDNYASARQDEATPRAYPQTSYPVTNQHADVSNPLRGYATDRFQQQTAAPVVLAAPVHRPAVIPAAASLPVASQSTNPLRR